MQVELTNQRPELPIQLLAVNAYGYSQGLSAMASNGDLPLLQDHYQVDAWGKWRVSLRDVVIANRNNEFVTVYNLGKYDLSEPESFDALKALLIDAAE